MSTGPLPLDWTEKVISVCITMHRDWLSLSLSHTHTHTHTHVHTGRATTLPHCPITLALLKMQLHATSTFRSVKDCHLPLELGAMKQLSVRLAWAQRENSHTAWDNLIKRLGFWMVRRQYLIKFCWFKLQASLISSPLFLFLCRSGWFSFGRLPYRSWWWRYSVW